MHNYTALILFLLFIVLIAIIISRSRCGGDSYDNGYDGTEETTTTTTVVTEKVEQEIQGTLRKTCTMDGKQWFVHDPVDCDKVWVNPGDDLYEDGGGKIWRLI